MRLSTVAVKSENLCWIRRRVETLKLSGVNMSIIGTFVTYFVNCKHRKHAHSSQHDK